MKKQLPAFIAPGKVEADMIITAFQRAKELSEEDEPAADALVRDKHPQVLTLPPKTLLRRWWELIDEK